MDIALVANAASGSGTEVEQIVVWLGARGARVEVIEPGDVPADGSTHPVCARSERIAVASGDGTIGPVAASAAAHDRPLAVIPVGTANDFARSMGIPLDAEAACALAASSHPALRRIDLARAGDHPFVNAASAGLSVRATQAAIPLKPVFGPLAYGLGAVRAALTRNPVRAAITCDGIACWSGRAWQVTVAGTGAFGGGAEIDAAEPADGQLDVAVLTGARLRLLRHAYALRAGSVTDQPAVEHFRGREVVVEGPTEWNVDGETMRLASPRLTVAPRAFSLVVPVPVPRGV